MRPKILVVEDFPETAALIRELLEHQGYEALATDSALHAARLLDAEAFDLAVLDINLKEGTGYDVCRRIRAHPSRSGVPVIMLTVQDSVEEKAAGFASGADVYLTKPLDSKELLLWVDSLLRRSTGGWSDVSCIRSGPVSINPETRTVEVDGRIVRDLTAREFDLLHELARVRPRTLSREQLHSLLWTRDAPLTNTLEVHIKNLRRKLGPLGGASIVTMRGLGYRFE
ncbi:MAG: response regulator transcription factor [Elusimicrobiota bacterium]